MSDEQTLSTALATIRRILEEGVFIFTDHLEKDERPDADQWRARGVALDFAGPCTGALRMWAGEEFLRFAAANMLGVDEDSADAQEKGMDALKEILNMIVGNFLTALYGDKPVFDLGLPREIDAAALPADCADAGAIWLGAEGNPVLLVVEVGPRP
jgi:CheY-specific phosphatase CheX